MVQSKIKTANTIRRHANTYLWCSNRFINNKTATEGNLQLSGAVVGMEIFITAFNSCYFEGQIQTVWTVNSGLTAGVVNTVTVKSFEIYAFEYITDLIILIIILYRSTSRTFQTYQISSPFADRRTKIFIAFKIFPKVIIFKSLTWMWYIRIEFMKLNHFLDSAILL